MILNGQYTATVDRITEGIAAVLIESDGYTVAQRDVDAGDLPNGAGEGSVLSVTLVDSSITDLDYRPDETETRQKEVQDRFDSLSTRLSDRG